MPCPGRSRDRCPKGILLPSAAYLSILVKWVLIYRLIYVGKFKKSRGIKYVVFWAVAFVGAVYRKHKVFSRIAYAPLSAPAGSAWLLHKSIWVFAFLVTLQQTQATISVLPAFAPCSADSCISPQLRGVNAFTCHHLPLLQSRRWHFAGDCGGSHAIHFFIY